MARPEVTPLLERQYTDAEKANLQNATGDALPVLAVADFSPGPLWGFNGVQTLVLTEGQLFVVQHGLALTSGRLRRSFPMSSIQKLEWRIGRRRRREAVHMTLKIGRRRRHYTSKYRQAADLAQQLSGMVD
ncbi:MAG: hypothetical protein M3083_21910 [Actinomycetota bacterium]|nr:hypothetical protein [Actinomycetota bacterium]